ncbi:zinc finger CCCH domain-containing protein 3 [Diabrotica virgifera virgifera]|uniref:Zinc finger CCCH domain-containing protein 3 n=1 Tax=Diabrotica virgifera virgifera TaxID=50390 RepID=A0A6P7H4X9_DIAVI|nr:zinc finger CCCH domain-containing protein 3 [Diabrotica virgifera virgifera]
MQSHIGSSLNDPDVPFPNKYVYIKQNFILDGGQQPVPSKVLVNPHFSRKVFVNPNYNPNNNTIVPGKIHINPNVAMQKENISNKIHVNPKVINSIGAPTTLEPIKQPITYSSKTKLVRKPLKEQPSSLSKRSRRSSVYSKFKIVKSSAVTKPGEMKIKSKLLFNTKYKLKRINASNSNKYLIPQSVQLGNKYKLDRRSRSVSSSRSRFVFANRFLSISDIAKKVPLRTKSLVNISGIFYKKSPNKLQRTLSSPKDKKKTTKDANTLKKNRFKIVRQPENKSALEKKNSRITSRYSSRKNISVEKLKKCNIPCPYYRKFGKCKGKELGKCPRKHDPDQIALCTKFLQGACIDPKCLLSHNVSPEKMPTCKYYLEGLCSKDCCPYLHVKISPKADICRDFLEGFCIKASQCDKRHQFLCPDFEKNGTCHKPRCSYPHGRMVRKYSVFNKNKFAKKSSKHINENASTSKDRPVTLVNKKEETTEIESVNTRYYSDKNKENVQKCENGESSVEVDSNHPVNFKTRPRLGELPSFISFGDS